MMAVLTTKRTLIWKRLASVVSTIAGSVAERISDAASDIPSDDQSFLRAEQWGDNVDTSGLAICADCDFGSSRGEGCAAFLHD